MNLSRLIGMLGSIVTSALPATLAAQASSGAQIFTSINNSFPGGAGVGGIGLTIGNGAIAARGTFGVGLSGFNAASQPTSSGVPKQWAGDADVVVGNSMGGLAGIFAGALEPYAFVGIGAQSVSASPAFTVSAKTWSYGGGVNFPLMSFVGINGEVRYRNHLGNTYAAPSDFVNGTEYRVGISFNFGSSRSAGGYRPRSTNSASRPRPTGGSAGAPTRTRWPAGSTSASAAARRVVPDAERYIGVPYVYGGSSPRGFDCSGFVQYVYAQEGIDLPRTSRQMAGAGMAINPTPAAMAIGDLMLFAQGGRISHVAIYAGSGRFIHSSSSGNGVGYDDLNTRRGQWFADHLVAARRVAGDGGALRSTFASSAIPFDHFDPPDSAPPVRK